MFWNFVLGTLTQVKRIGYYYQPYPDTLSYSQWRNDDYIAAGFGFYLQITDAMQTAAEELYGCIINGKIYGKMTSVRDGIKDVTPSSYKLYPAFPNPFNPSTTISYTLPEDGKVQIKVFDALGREVAKLVDGEVVAGNHTATFDGSKLSSGIYFVRFMATPQNGNQPITKTMKMLMVK